MLQMSQSLPSLHGGQQVSVAGPASSSLLLPGVRRTPPGSPFKRSAMTTLGVSPAASWRHNDGMMSPSATLMTNRSRRSASSVGWDKLKGQKTNSAVVDCAFDYKRPYSVAYLNIVRERNLKKVDTLFKETDADGSGFLSLDEWFDAMKCRSAQATFAALGVQPHQAGVIFHAFDRDQDGQLSHEEFMLGLQRLLKMDDDGNSRDIDLEMLRAANLRLHDDMPEDEKPVVNRLPQAKLHRAFVHSAIAQALNPACASMKAAPRRVIMR